jgi:tetratricopeptide (TPR) repeat protein/transcriptional regulator with XRE-family HTH domain
MRVTTGQRDGGAVAEQPGLSFAGLLRQLRAEVKLTQEELAEAASLSPRSISDLERGINRTARKDTALLLADVFGLAGPVRVLFVAAARGRVPAVEVLAARKKAPSWPPGQSAGRLPGHDAPATPEPAPVPVPRELPADVSGFTGREAELAELDWLLPAAGPGTGATCGPVVISAVSGTAGVGKTALAVRWAHRVQSEFPDGQLYVNLRGFDPGPPVPAADALAGFLRALGVAGADIPPGESERAARFRSAVAGKRLLVLLDNAASVEQVRPLLPGAATVMVVVTSRDSLAGLVARDGAHRIDLDLLPGAEAVALLRALIGERADADPAATKALAERCARLPLALRVAAELAAARRDQPLAALVAELASEEPLERLDAGGDPRGAVASVFSWSCRHLPAGAARMFRLLGLHPGPDWDRHAAAALSGATVAEARQMLGLLARAHLIQAAGADRYGFHDLLRAYAAGLCAAQEDEPTRRACLAGLFGYYLAACAAAMNVLAPAERHHRPDPPRTDMAVPEFADLAAARTWLDTELATLTAIVGYTAGHGWPGHTLLLAGTVHRYLYGGHDAEGLTICGHALDAARACQDRAAEAHALTSLGNFHYRHGRHQQADDHHQRALTLARDIGDRLAQARALGNLAIQHARRGDYQVAADYHRQALVLVRELGDRVGEANALTNLGNVYLRQGSYQEAADLQERALGLLREIGHWHGETLLTDLGEACYRLGRYEQAVSHLGQALAVSREIGDRVAEAKALARLGQVCHRRGRYEEAADYSERALTLYRQMGHREGEGIALNGAGETLLAAGQPAKARACHFSALSLTRESGNRREQARALASLAAVCRGQGRYAEAAEYDPDALACYQEIGDPGGEADALNGSGETLLAAGEPAAARRRHLSALTLTRRTGDRYQQARAYQGLGGTYHALGHDQQAREFWWHALAIYADLGVPEASELRASLAAGCSPWSGRSRPERMGGKVISPPLGRS